MNEKILICGRSGSGKDTFAKLLKQFGLKDVCSYTTRPRRDGEGDTHIFISENEVNKYPNKIAITEINGYTYFATKEQLEEADYYIIDPNGIDYLHSHFPEIKYRIVYIYADRKIRKQRAIARGGKKEGKIFVSRNKSENAQFSNFEKNLYKQNVTVFVNNEDNIENLKNFAKMYL